MNLEQSRVRDFHQAMGHRFSEQPTVDIDPKDRDLRINLIDEEFNELVDAIENDNLIGIADGLADLLYVVYGCALAYGLDMEPLFAEVHRSNMTKGGGKRRIDGKISKGPNYQAPKLQPILDRLSERVTA